MPPFRRGRGSSPEPADRPAPRPGGRSAMTRPRSRQTRRSQHARQQLDVVIDDQHAAAGVAQSARKRRQRLALMVADAGGRLVEQQEGGVRRHRAREVSRLGVAGQHQRLEGAADAGAGDRMRRQALDASVVERMVPASARSRPLIDIEQRRLARAVGSDQPDDLAALEPAARHRPAPRRRRSASITPSSVEPLRTAAAGSRRAAGRAPPAAAAAHRAAGRSGRPALPAPTARRPAWRRRRPAASALQVAQQLGQADGERRAQRPRPSDGARRPAPPR